MTKKNIIGSYVYTARDYTRELINMRNGDIFMGAFNAEQVMYNHFGYRTPIPNLYMASSSGHPGYDRPRTDGRRWRDPSVSAVCCGPERHRPRGTAICAHCRFSGRRLANRRTAVAIRLYPDRIAPCFELKPNRSLMRCVTPSSPQH